MKNVFFAFFFLLASQTYAQETFKMVGEQSWTMEHREIPSAPLTAEELQNFEKSARQQCAEDHKDRFDVQELITLGKEIWKIIEDGAPVMNYETNTASVIPAKAQCPIFMSQWNPPQSKTFELRYKNGFNMDMVYLSYKLIYTCGGRFENKGHYLANVSIHPQDLEVGWGYNFDANVRIADSINVGSMEDPVAGLEVALEWEVKTALKVSHAKHNFFVDGLCRVTEL